MGKRKKIGVCVLFLFLIALIPWPQNYLIALDTFKSDKPSFILVVDAGHGGPDNGASADDGTPEKNINLSIARLIKREAEKKGMKVILTRHEDKGLGAEHGTWTKIADLEKRREIISKAKADLAISIHLNSFRADSSVSGAQVFYPSDRHDSIQEKGKEIAEKIQAKFNEKIEGNNRMPHPKNDLLIFKDCPCPIVLIECGFLSNEEDKNNLKNVEFQRIMSVYIIEVVNRML